MKLCIHTLGCKVNLYESVCIEEEFIKHGYEVTENNEEADVIVINTCTVTNQADAKSRKLIRQARRENENACLVVCGCSSEHHKNELLDLGVNILLGTDGKTRIYSLVTKWLEEKETVSLFTDMRFAKFENMAINHMEGKTRGFVKIEDGCNNFCTFCIIPFMRGRTRSKDFNEAVEEINTLANNGYQEVVLTGIHTGAYGEGEDFDLTDLIREVSRNDNLKRIRISSIEITELNDKFMEELKNNKKICSHMHVPVQCPNDEILKAMHRKYTLDEFKNKVNELRSIRPDINITTDLIVGFPGETDAIFNSVLDECVNIGFSKIHTFPYSMRTGTKAAEMEQVKDSDKKDRTSKMLRMSDMLESKYYQQFIGKELTILVEDGIHGFSDNYIKVTLNKEMPVNSMVKVVVTSVDGISVNADVIV